MKTMSETMKEVESKKRSLEEQVDALNEEVSKMKALEQTHQVASDKRKEDTQMKEALEAQIEQHREQHQKQVAHLRNEIEEKQSLMAELKDELQKLSLAFDQLQGDHEKVKAEEQEKSKRLNVSSRMSKWSRSSPKNTLFFRSSSRSTTSASRPSRTSRVWRRPWPRSCRPSTA